MLYLMSYPWFLQTNIVEIFLSLGTLALLQYARGILDRFQHSNIHSSATLNQNSIQHVFMTDSHYIFFCISSNDILKHKL